MKPMSRVGPLQATTLSMLLVGSVPGVAADDLEGGTTFFGIRDKGTRILYVVDRSPSMFGRRFETARKQVLASVEKLAPEQEFQVLLFTNTPEPMQLMGSRPGPSGVYAATKVNKAKTREYLDGVDAAKDGKTDRKLALERALGYRPDVIYLLTDDDPVDLDRWRGARLRELDRRFTPIHGVQLGRNPESSGRTPLESIVIRNGGKYRYVRVEQLP